MSVTATPARICAALAACAAWFSACEQGANSTAGKGGASVEPVFRYSLLDNGDFSEVNESVVDASGVKRIPWWRASRARVELVRAGVEPALEERAYVAQPLAFFAPYASTLRIRRGVAAGGMIEVRDGGGRVVSEQSTGFDAVGEMSPSSDAAAPLTPRLELRLVAPTKDASADPREWVRGVDASVDLPCPSEAALRAELAAEIDAIFTTWFARAGDDVGPKRTQFLVRDFDAVTGAPGRNSASTGFSSFYQALFDASTLEDRPAWKALFSAFFTDFLALQLHPTTGLPRGWNPITDTAIDDGPTEIALAFGFLIDVAERGPESMRGTAKSAALKIGETVLAHGLLPDGNCAASFVPASAAPNVKVSHLRRLDVPLQLVRLSKLTGDERFAAAAREPLETLEFTNYWHGTWDEIDPGFDDSFGHYGARAARAAREKPDEKYFARFALEGWKHYEPIWRDALRFGGNVAADQARCWRIGVDLARVDPSLKSTLGPLLRSAARSHFKGEQYENGAWGDVTIFDFQPKTLHVGDLSGAPQNLLTGLATIYTDDVGLRTDEIRAMYTSVFRSTVEQYRRPYGYLLVRKEQQGTNSAYGSVRVLSGLVDMLSALAKPR